MIQTYPRKCTVDKDKVIGFRPPIGVDLHAIAKSKGIKTSKLIKSALAEYFKNHNIAV